MATGSSELSYRTERANFQRVTYLLIQHGTSALREIFDSIIPPNQLTTRLTDPAVVAQLHGARLTRYQWTTLYPPSRAGPVKSSDFDITLLSRLLRTICNLKQPVTGWDDLPGPSDTSLEADLVRIKYYRNSVYGHVRDLKITEAEFETLWKEISFAVLGLARRLSSEKELEYKEATDELLTAPMVPKDDQELQQLIEQTLTRKLSEVTIEQNTHMEESMNKAVSEITTWNKEFMEETMDRNFSMMNDQLARMEGMISNTPKGILQMGRIGSGETKASHQQTRVMKEKASNSSGWQNALTNKTCNQASEEKKTHRLTKTINKGWNELHFAAQGGNARVIKKLLSLGFNQEARTDEGYTPLMIAACYEKADAVNCLLYSDGADLSAVDQKGRNVLHFASQGGDVNIIEKLLSFAIDVNSRTDTGHTPLTIAAFYGKTKAVNCLLNVEADRFVIAFNGWNLLHTASGGGDVATIEKILSTGIGINSRTDEGFTPLMLAAFGGNSDAVKYLISVGADQSAVSHNGFNVLHWAVEGGDIAVIEVLSEVIDINSKTRDDNGLTTLMVAVANGNVENIDYLLSIGTDHSAVAKSGINLLHIASAYGNVAIIKKVLLLGLQLESRSTEGLTSLMVAAALGEAGAVDCLLNEGADPLAVCHMGCTALLYASQGGNITVTKKLLSVDVDINSRTRNGYTPLLTAAKNGYLEVFNYLISEGADQSAVTDWEWNLLHMASQGGNVSIIQNILSLGFDIESRTNKGLTPLMLAAVNRQVEAVTYLIDAGADHSAVDSEEWNVLHHASLGGDVTVIQKILSVGVDINSRTNLGNTPLMLAVSSCKVDAINYLISEKADQGAVSCVGANLLHCASQGGDVTIIQKMISLGIDINSKTVDDVTPMHHALLLRNEEAAKVLLARGADLRAVDRWGRTPLLIALQLNLTNIVDELLSLSFH